MFYMTIFAVISMLTRNHQAAPISSSNIHPDTGLNIIEFAEKYGYPLESHEVLTEDGYILTLHRINNKNLTPNSTRRAPVLLMHGILGSSIDWLNHGPDKALGLLLADRGYDVWLGNQRGNTWSRRHVEIDADKDNSRFFNFTFHEIGFYDIPAKIDYILNVTGDSGVYYVGHSQGATVFFVMASERPEYNDKIKLVEALAPAVFMGNLPNMVFRAIGDELDVFQNVLRIMGVYEFLPHYSFMTNLAKYLCNNDSYLQVSCTLLLNLIAGFDWQIDTEFTPVIYSNLPAGSSTGQFWHFLQGYNSNNFQQYDFGYEMNLIKYGQTTPPLYNLKNVSAPVILHYSKNDQIVAYEDIEILIKNLPNLKKSKQVELEQFNHLDFLWAKDVVELLYNEILNELEKN